MRISCLPPASTWSHALYPADPATGARSRVRGEQAVTIDDPAAVDAFFARQAD